MTVVSLFEIILRPVHVTAQVGGQQHLRLDARAVTCRHGTAVAHTQRELALHRLSLSVTQCEVHHHRRIRAVCRLVLTYPERHPVMGSNPEEALGQHFAPVGEHGDLIYPSAELTFGHPFHDSATGLQRVEVFHLSTAHDTHAQRFREPGSGHAYDHIAVGVKGIDREGTSTLLRLGQGRTEAFDTASLAIAGQFQIATAPVGGQHERAHAFVQRRGNEHYGAVVAAKAHPLVGGHAAGRHTVSHAAGLAFHQMATLGIKRQFGQSAFLVGHGRQRPRHNHAVVGIALRKQQVGEVERIFGRIKDGYHPAEHVALVPVGHGPRVGPHLIETRRYGTVEGEVAVGAPVFDGERLVLPYGAVGGEQVHIEHPAQRRGQQRRRPEHVGLEPDFVAGEIAVVVEMEVHFFLSEIVFKRRNVFQKAAEPAFGIAGMNRQTRRATKEQRRQQSV